MRDIAKCLEYCGRDAFMKDYPCGGGIFFEYAFNEEDSERRK